jgi:F-type H+-transporting ATPase subunit b
MDALFTINPGLVVWTFINFTILAVLLGKFAFPAIKNMMQERHDRIQNTIDEAKEANLRAESLLKESQAKLDNAQNEAATILNNGKKQAQQFISDARTEAEVQRTRMIQDAQKEIENQKNKAIVELRKEVAALAVDAAEKIINQKLDREAHMRLIKESMQNLPKN